MEKVVCIKCGSVGYTASPESVNCDKCGGKHKRIEGGYKDWVPGKRNRILSLLCTKSG